MGDGYDILGVLGYSVFLTLLLTFLLRTAGYSQKGKQYSGRRTSSI
jgi:hypothetical protein